jgi:GNAT superfamily N-acetyltransferase
VLGIVGSVGFTIRPATYADLRAITDTVSAAFFADPVWSWAFPDAEHRMEQYARWWPTSIEAGLRNDTVWVTDGCEAVAIWIPPGVTEMTEQEEARLGPLLHELTGDRAAEVLDGVERFELSHPHDEPHWYLSIVATHPDHRGHGIGVALIADHLRRVDEQGRPAYLESSNPVNFERYRRLGFERSGEFSMPDDGPTVTTMWRDARGTAR